MDVNVGANTGELDLLLDGGAVGLNVGANCVSRIAAETIPCTNRTINRTCVRVEKTAGASPRPAGRRLLRANKIFS